MIQSQRLGTDLLLLRLNRPHRLNALTLQLLEDLAQALSEADADASVRGIVLAGAGRSFCAGVDLEEFASGTEASVRQLMTALTRLGAVIRQIPIPVACAIHGHCLGGALELALCCDFRVAAHDARLGMPEILVSLPSVGDALMLERHIGIGRAREMILTGESITGEVALSWGLVNRVASADNVIDVAATLVRIVSAHQPEVIGAQKRLHHESLNLPYNQGVEGSIESLVDAFRDGKPQAVARELLRRQ